MTVLGQRPCVRDSQKGPMTILRDDTERSHSAQDKRSAQSTPPLKRPSRQADEGPEPLGNADRGRQPDNASAATVPDDDGHLGATEEQVSETPAPAGDAFEDEPKQG